MKKIEELEQKLAELQNEIDKLKTATGNKYPMKLVDLGTWNCIGYDKLFDFKKYKTFAQLVETCREWNRIDDFVPDWENDGQPKYGIFYASGKLGSLYAEKMSYSLHFMSHETAQLFLNTYRTEIEQVKHLL